MQQLILKFSTIIQKRRTTDETASCVTQSTLGGYISLHDLKVKAGEDDLFNVRLLQKFRGVRILCYYCAVI